MRENVQNTVWVKFAIPKLGGCRADDDDGDDDGDYGDYGDDENSALHGPGAALRER